MSQQVLEKLFDSSAKLRLLKLFLRNPNSKFTHTDIRKRTLLDARGMRSQLGILSEIGLIKSSKKQNVKEYEFSLNPKFIFFEELQNLIQKPSPADESKMATKIKGLGRVKLVVISGIFMNPERGNSRADLVLVIDDVRKKKLDNFMRNLEAEAGVEIRYSLMDSDEFNYRYKMFDRFIHDTFEKPHRKLINKILV